MTYSIHTEFHVMPAVAYNGRPGHEVDFHYAIRRDDGSLLFRTETLAYAEEIVSRLAYTTNQRAAA